MRKSLLETFDEIYVLNLHGNARKKEVAPDGGKDECVFNIMQGVAITLFVKKGGSAAKNAKCAKVYYADLWGKKKDKLATLDAATMESVAWKELQLAEPYCFFVPKDFALEDEYNKGFSVAELFLKFGLGVKSERDDVAIHFTREGLKETISDFSQMEVESIRAKYHLGKDSRDWSIARARNDVLDHSDFEAYAKPILLRCFDSRWIFYPGTTRGFVGTPAYPTMQHMLQHNLGLCLIRNSRGHDAVLPFAAKGLVGKDAISSLDNCRVFPLYLYEENMGKVEKRANLDKDIVAKIAAAVGDGTPTLPTCSTRSARLNNPPSPEDIFDYIYGVLHSPAYRAKFKEFLKVDFPRIPYPKDAAEFSRFRDAGRELCMVHLMRDAEPTLSETRARFPVVGDNTVDKVEWEDGRVYINATQYFDNVPVEAWEQPIGGYRPAEKWLKDRKGRILTQNDLKHYQRIILALMKTAEVVEKLAAVDREEFCGDNA